MFGVFEVAEVVAKRENSPNKPTDKKLNKRTEQVAIN